MAQKTEGWFIKLIIIIKRLTGISDKESWQEEYNREIKSIIKASRKHLTKKEMERLERRARLLKMMKTLEKRSRLKLVPYIFFIFVGAFAKEFFSYLFSFFSS